MTEHLTKETFCVDVWIENNENEREQLITALRKDKEWLGVTKVQRGVWDDVKILRVYTPNGIKLQNYLNRLDPFASRKYKINIYDSKSVASCSETFLPDLDTEFGYEKFDL